MRAIFIYGIVLIIIILLVIPRDEKEIMIGDIPIDLIPKEIPKLKFMDKMDVLKIANKELSDREVMDETLDQASLERLHNLTPINEMFEDYPVRMRAARSFQKNLEIKEEDLKEDVDLREFATPAKSQWNGTCTAFGLTSVQELMLCKQNKVCNVDISERHRWSMYKKYSAITALEYAHKHVADEAQWPQDKVNGPDKIEGKYTIDEYEYLGDNKDLVISELSKGNAIYFWSQTPNCMLKCKKVCSKSEKTFADGGHAYAVVGYYQKDDPVLLIKNSWGDDCGDNGFQALPFSIWDNASYWEAAVIKKVSMVGGSTPDPIPPAKVKKCEWRWSYKHFWSKRKYCWYE